VPSSGLLLLRFLLGTVRHGVLLILVLLLGAQLLAWLDPQASGALVGPLLLLFLILVGLRVMTRGLIG
jgi:hypothetical protein